MSRPLIIDHGHHLADVLASARSIYDVTYDVYDLGSNEVSFEQIEQALAYAAQSDATCVNLSYGGGNTQDCATLRDLGDYESIFRALFAKGVPVIVAAGNEGRSFSEGVSLLASTPFNISVGAIQGGGRFEPYSQRSPLLMNLANDGYAPDGHQGTSFATPRTFAEIARLRDTGYSGLDAYLAVTRAALAMPAAYGDYYQSIHPLHLQGEFNRPTVNAAWTLTAAYEVLMGRQPDNAGLRYWIGEVDHGRDLDEVVRSMVGTARLHGVYGLDRVPPLERMVSAYVLFLNRLPDLEGLAWWLGEITARRFDYSDGYLRASDIDWRRVMAAFLNPPARASEATRFLDLADQFIATAPTAPFSAAATAERVMPKAFVPC